MISVAVGVNVRFTCIAANCQRLLQAFLFIMYMKLPPLVMYSNPCCRIYAAPAFTVIRLQLSGCLIIVNKAQINRIITLGINFHLTLSSRHSTTALVSFIFWFSLSPFHFLSSLLHPFDTSLCLFPCPDLSKFPSKPVCCHCARGIWRDDQVKMMCCAAFFFFSFHPPE